VSRSMTETKHLDFNAKGIPLTVIVVNRNTADLLIRCVDHVYGSRLESRPQVVVVDNGSSDESVTRLRETYPDAVVIEAGRNLGFAAANNRALGVASGKFLLLVNTDALLAPEAAGRLLNLMESYPDIGMAGPQLFNPDGTVQTSYEAVPTLATETLNRSLLKRLFPRRFPHKSRRSSVPISVEALIGAVMMIRREALKELGGFDEDYFFFLEETDLAVRMRKAGWRVVHEPRAHAVHLQGATAKRFHAAARIEFYRSRYLFFNKHYGPTSAAVLKAALTANLSLNVLALSASAGLTLGRVAPVVQLLAGKTALWRWHLQGCPDGPGLPRD
jgi:GT2 family glycosyltransferase